MESKQLIEKTKEHVKKELSSEFTGHDYWHIHRVWKLSKQIGKKEDVNLQVVELAALLHDLGDSKLFDYENESDPARDWLSKLTKDEALINHVCHIIDNMSFQKELEEESVDLSLEGQVVQDADRLDAIGAVGIARAFAYGGNRKRLIHNPSKKPNLSITGEEYLSSNGTTINHFYEKLLLVKDKMNTDIGKEMAEKRHAFMKEFLDRFYKEWEGKK